MSELPLSCPGIPDVNPGTLSEPAQGKSKKTESDREPSKG